MKKNISIILNILLVVLLIGIAYGWMQTEPSMGENIEYNRDFYITDSDIDVKLYALVNNTYVLQGQQNDDALINLEEMYPGKIQRYRFELINKNDVAAKVKIIFTEITGNINLMKNYLKISVMLITLIITFIFYNKYNYIESYDYVKYPFYVTLAMLIIICLTIIINKIKFKRS